MSPENVSISVSKKYCLKSIFTGLRFQVHQLETILSALEDYSIVVREKLHIMLQASTIGTKDGLQNVVNKLLDNLKKYPQVSQFTDTWTHTLKNTYISICMSLLLYD